MIDIKLLENIQLCAKLEMHENTCVKELLVLDKNTWKHLIVWKQDY